MCPVCVPAPPGVFLPVPHRLSGACLSPMPRACINRTQELVNSLRLSSQPLKSRHDTTGSMPALLVASDE